MYKYRKIISIAAAMLILFGALGFGGISRAKAIEPGLYEVDGNATCAGLYLLDPELMELGPLFGFKYDGNPTADLEHTLTNDGKWILEPGTPSDSINSVRIFNIVLKEEDDKEVGYIFDWAATLGIDAVIVKAKDSNAYVYYPEEYGDEGLHAIDYKSISHISFCYDYELDVEKTATAEFTRTYEWEITKDYDATYDLLAGGRVDHDYLVTVTKTGFTDSDFKVTGTITVTNNTPFDGVAYTVTDKVGTNTAVVTCPETQVLDSGKFAVCTYSVDLPEKVNGTNVAMVATTHAFVEGAQAEAEYVFGEPTTKVNDTINVSDTNDPDGLGSASGFTEFDYSKTFECSADSNDYTNGFYTYDHTNTATIDETGQSDDAIVTINCYAPVVTKTADEYFTRYWDWDIKKVDDGVYDRFISESVEHDYKVSVTPTTTDNDWQVKGTITVTNSHPTLPMVLTSVSDIAGGISAKVTCPSMIVPADGKLDCTYETYEQDSPDSNPFGSTNTATAVFAEENWIGTATISFPTAPTSEVGKEITVDDDNLEGEEWSANGAYAEWTYKKTFTCSSDPDFYKDGKYTITNKNTATINETGDSDTATVTVDCYAPVVSKTAVGTYDLRYTWDVEKSVTPLDQSGYPGDILSWTWTVDVSESSAPENYAVNGVITVVNNHPTEAMTVSIADVLDDGTPVTLDCGGSLTVPAAGSNTCAYSAVPDDDSATKNTVTATYKGIDFSYDAAVSFDVDKTYNGTADIDDDMESDFPLTLTVGEGPWQWTETYSHTCSELASAYGEDGTYTGSKKNTATVDGSDQEPVSSSAFTTYLCKAGFVDLLKHTNGEIDTTKDWQFALYLGPDGFDTTPIATDSTLNDEDGLLDFGGPALRPDTTYTICELGVPAGYTTFWQINGVTFVPYNPNADDSTPEVLGNYCVDFNPTVVGETVHFFVDNQEGGGDPRTPGYWKNWNTCTGGGQANTAFINGGWEEGFWLLDDVLDPNNGDGIIWDDILEDNFTFPITSCKLAVSILNTKDFVSGKVLASDPGYNLAKHLLAAQLNFGAGACKPAFEVYSDMTIDEVALAAEKLLDEVNFDAVDTGISKKDKKVAAYALELATILDNYNNGMYCGTTYVSP